MKHAINQSKELRVKKNPHEEFPNEGASFIVTEFPPVGSADGAQQPDAQPENEPEVQESKPKKSKAAPIP